MGSLPRMAETAASSADARYTFALFAEPVGEVPGGRGDDGGFLLGRPSAFWLPMQREQPGIPVPRATGAVDGVVPSAVSCASSIFVGARPTAWSGAARRNLSAPPAARKCPMLVMHEPMNTSSTSSPVTGEESGVIRVLERRMGLLDSTEKIWMTAAYSMSGSAS